MARKREKIKKKILRSADEHFALAFALELKDQVMQTLDFIFSFTANFFPSENCRKFDNANLKRLYKYILTAKLPYH